MQVQLLSATLTCSGKKFCSSGMNVKLFRLRSHWKKVPPGQAEHFRSLKHTIDKTRVSGTCNSQLRSLKKLHLKQGRARIHPEQLGSLQVPPGNLLVAKILFKARMAIERILGYYLFLPVDFQDSSN